MGLAYCDASALVKLLRQEPDSAAFERFLQSAVEVSSSAIVAVELMRAARRLETYGLAAERAAEVLAAVTLLEIDGELLNRAGRLAPPKLRALDALHLATALSLGDRLDVFVAYDRRLAQAAREVGLQVVAPGAEASIA